MFFLRMIHVFLCAIQTAISIVIFSDLDEVTQKPELTARISDHVYNFFFGELVISFLIALLGLSTCNLLIMVSSIPMFCYNVYGFYKKHYNLHFSIGEIKENKKNYNNASLRHKIKFGINSVVLVIAFVSLVLTAMYYYLEQFLSSKTAMRTLMKFVGLIDEA